MRVSIRSDDPGYDYNAIGSKVFVDGVEVKNCFTADEEMGVAWCFAVDEEGKFFIDPENTDSCKEIEVRGKVRIMLPASINKHRLKDRIGVINDFFSSTKNKEQ